MLESTVLWVSGICCEDCRNRLTAALRAVPGVDRVYLDLAQNEATVWGTAERAALRAAVTAAGFALSPYPVPEARGIG